MDLVNWQGSALFGPGSEWFWSMAQFVVVAVTLVGIYYQLRIQRDANAFEQMDKLSTEWESELMMRHRVEILVALRDGSDAAEIPAGSAGYIANFWERVASLVRAGHMDRRMVYEALGTACRWWWAAIAPNTRRFRLETGETTSGEHHEWLASMFADLDRKGGIDAQFDKEHLARMFDRAIESGRDRLRIEEAMRAVTLQPAASAAAPPRTVPTAGLEPPPGAPD